MRTLCTLLVLVFPSYCFAQLGGKHFFEFLNVPVTARLAGLGGVNVSLVDRDPDFFATNPALTGDSLDRLASLSYQFYAGDIGQAFVSYTHHAHRAAVTFRIGVQHLNYGQIQGYDPGGAETGIYHASETALIFSASHQRGNFRIGANLKPVFSNIAGFRYGGILFDIGGVFVHPEKSVTVGMVIRNAGFRLGANRTQGTLPFDVQLGTTFKPEHMPIRFSLTAHQLTQGDISYHDPASGREAPGTLAKVFAHINFGTEILLHRNVNVLAGYNFLHHQTLRLERGGGGAGVSLGLSITTKMVDFTFSRSGYVAGSAGYAFTLFGDMQKLVKSRKAL